MHIIDLGLAAAIVMAPNTSNHAALGTLRIVTFAKILIHFSLPAVYELFFSASRLSYDVLALFLPERCSGMMVVGSAFVPFPVSMGTS